MSASRKRLLWAFSAVTALLTLVLLAVEERRGPAPRPKPPGLATPLPEDDATLRIGFFAIGPDDIEPRLVDELIVGLDSPVAADLSHRSLRPEYRTGTSWSFGVRAPSLISPPEELTMVEGEDPFHLEARLEEGAEGRRMLACSLDAMFAGGGTEGAMIRLEAGPAVRVFVDPTGFESEAGWRTDFVLGRTEGKTTGHWNLEQWRAAIVEGLGQRDVAGNPDRHAAAQIPCPAARESLADGKEHDEFTARLLAGDARAAAEARPSDIHLLGWRLRTIWLKYPDMRPFAREHLIASGWRCPAGRLLAPRFEDDPELASALGPWTRAFPRERIPAVAFLLVLALAFVLVGLRARAANPGRAAAWASVGCVLALVQLDVNGVGLTNFLALPLFCGAAFGLRAAAPTGPLAARWARALAAGVLACQVWRILEAPSLVSQVGSVAYAMLPLVLLAATDSQVPEDESRRTDRALWWYAFLVLLLPVSSLLTDLVDRALGRDVVGLSIEGAGALVVVVASVVGMLVAAVRFGRLRKRMREPRRAAGLDHA